MSTILETLKQRLAVAQARIQQTTQKLQQAQVDHQQASQEFMTWQQAVNFETLREQAEARESGSNTSTQQAPPPTANTVTPTAAPEINQTAMIRNLLQNHPEGLTATELWEKVDGQISQRAYLYGVLKRLRDRNEVVVRRHKYFPKLMPKIEEAKEQRETVH